MTDKQRDKQRWIVVEYTVRLPTQVRKDQTEDQINFWLNESTWCVGENLMDQMVEVQGPEEDRCNLCVHAKGKYLRNVRKGEDPIKASYISD